MTPPHEIELGPTCVLCGCSFEGVHPKAPCPKCRYPAVYSAPGRTLDQSALASIRNLRNGWLLVVLSLIAGVVFSVLVILLDPIVDSLERPWQAIIAISVLIAAAGNLSLQFLGWWKLSAPDPALADASDGGRVRRWLRVSMVLVVLATVGNAALPSLVSIPESDDAILRLGLLVLISRFVGYLADLSLYLAGFALLAWISTRLPSLVALRRSRRGMKWLIACAASIVVLGLGTIWQVLAPFSMIPLIVLGISLVTAVAGALIGLLYFLTAMRRIWLVLNPLYQAKHSEAVSP